MMGSLIKKVLGVVFCMALASHAFGEEDTESTRVGVEGLVTADGVHAGIVSLGRFFELAVDFDWSTTLNSGPKTGDMGVDLRGGYRMSAGAYNSFSLGVNWHNSVFGKDAGVSTAGTNYVGPYVGFQRFFPNSPVAVVFFVDFLTYNQEVANDGNGEKKKTFTVSAFQAGGLGIAYFF